MPAWYYKRATFLVAIYLLSALVLFLSWYQWRCLSALVKPAVSGSLMLCSRQRVPQLLVVTLQPCLPCWHRFSALCAGRALQPELDVWGRNAACASTAVALQIRKRKDHSKFWTPCSLGLFQVQENLEEFVEIILNILETIAGPWRWEGHTEECFCQSVYLSSLGDTEVPAQ